MDKGRGNGGGGSGKKKAAGAGAAAAPAWKKPPGANLSAKAKKEYLKWKREQKRNQADDDGADSDWGQMDAIGGVKREGEDVQEQPQPAAAAAAGGGGGRMGRAAGGKSGGGRRPPSVGADQRGQVHRGQQQQQQRQQQQARGGQRVRGDADVSIDFESIHREALGDEDEVEEEADEEGEEEADAGGAARAVMQPRQLQGPGGGGRAVPDDKPLCYVTMLELPPGDVPESIRAVCGDDLKAMRLPRVREDEVGFAEEGRRLGMPKRPHWRGVVRNADQLHRLEERSFQSWVDRMYASVDSPSRISFFEPKLDFWRQLWRVLERSDVAIVIVDARNPLLHFSEALARHVIDDHGIPALLVLNKCDLVPASCVEQWRRFFEGRYPGLRVVASSASAAGGRGAAEAIMDAVLDSAVTRDGKRLKVSEVIQMSRDEILAASKARNTHSKRDRPQAPAAAAGALRQPQRQRQAVPLVEGSGTDAATSGAEAEEIGAESGDGEDDAAGGWELKGNKARKKEAVRRKRIQRMHGAAGGDGGGGGGAPAGGAATTTTTTTKTTRAAGRGRDGSRSRSVAVTAAAAEAEGLSAAVGDQHNGGDDGGDVAEEGEGGSVGWGGRDGEDTGGEAADDNDDEEEDDNDNAAFDQLVADEDEEGFLLEEDEDDNEEEGDGGRGAGGGAKAAWGGHGARGGRDRRGRSRPVVVCVVGEPNVGKSSTMNALLGAKRVAVSSHPGRTKHYQTHMMCPSLMLCDCPGLVFPRLDVSLYMQVLFGSYPIARCRDPYAVVRYLAERVWPRLHRTLGLKPVREDEEEEEQEQGLKGSYPCGQREEQQQEWRDENWTPLALCEALAARHNWRSRRGGRLDVYRAANWVLRSALAGRNGVNVAFLSPEGHDNSGDYSGASGEAAAPY